MAQMTVLENIPYSSASILSVGAWGVQAAFLSYLKGNRVLLKTHLPFLPEPEETSASGSMSSWYPCPRGRRASSGGLFVEAAWNPWRATQGRRRKSMYYDQKMKTSLPAAPL